MGISGIPPAPSQVKCRCGSKKLKTKKYESQKENAHGTISSNSKDKETWHLKCGDCGKSGSVQKTTSISSSNEGGIHGAEFFSTFGCVVKID